MLTAHPPTKTPPYEPSQRSGLGPPCPEQRAPLRPCRYANTRRGPGREWGFVSSDTAQKALSADETRQISSTGQASSDALRTVNSFVSLGAFWVSRVQEVVVVVACGRGCSRLRNATVVFSKQCQVRYCSTRSCCMRMIDSYDTYQNDTSYRIIG